MYEMLDLLALRGVSAVCEDAVMGWLPRLSGLGPEVLRDDSSLLVMVVAVSFCKRLRRRGKACREGVLEVGVDANAEDVHSD